LEVLQTLMLALQNFRGRQFVRDYKEAMALGPLAE
jgi:hypothetical protein